MPTNNTLRFTSYVLGGLGIVIAVIPFVPVVFIQIGSSIRQQQLVIESQLQKASIDQREGLKQHTIKSRAETLDTQSRIGEHITYSTVKVENFTDNVQTPPKLDVSAFKPNQHIQVFDKNGVCIGRIRHQKFEWKHHYLNTCLTLSSGGQ